MTTLNLILLAAALVTFFWRAAGALFAKRVRVHSPLFNLAGAITYAIVGALIIKLIIYPQGMLSATTLPVRLLATAGGLATFFALRRNVPAGSWAGVATLLLITLTQT